MPSLSLTPSQAASQAGISVHSVRRWSAEFADYLSPGANPAKGTSRRRSAQYVQVLQEIARLRGEGLSTGAIAERLAGVVFAPPVAAQVAPGAAQALALPEYTLQQIETRLAALEANRWRVDVVIVGLVGFLAGLIIGLAVWWFQ